jgi:hypothetical protein
MKRAISLPFRRSVGIPRSSCSDAEARLPLRSLLSVPRSLRPAVIEAPRGDGVANGVPGIPNPRSAAPHVATFQPSEFPISQLHGDSDRNHQ